MSRLFASHIKVSIVCIDSFQITIFGRTTQFQSQFSQFSSKGRMLKNHKKNSFETSI